MDKFCTMPFRRMDITTNGDVHLCVKGWMKNEAEASVGNVQKNTAQEVWLGEKAQAFRQSIIDKTYKFCCENKCPWLNSPEEHGTPLVSEQPTVPDKPEIVNASYDLTCNLFCVSCRKDIIVDMNYQKHELFRQRIQELGDIDELIMIGSGDPFSSPHVREWMKSGEVAAKKIMLHTNATLLTRERWENLPPEIKDKIRKIEISIDAASKEIYENVRRGFQWEILQENLEFISELRKTHLEYLKFSFVAYSPNYKEMPDFVRMAIKLGVDDVYFSRVEDWFAFGCETELFQVHLPAHVEHQKLQEVLEDPILKHPIVRLGNLAKYKKNAT